jgi:Virulence factor
MARYRILSWRDIPAQIKVYSEQGRPTSIPLDNWFVTEIDRVAMREGLVGTDAYLEQFNWSADFERPGSADEVAAQLVAELEQQWLPEGMEK